MKEMDMYSNNVVQEGNVHTMLNPESVAVIGASQTKGSIGFTLFENLINSEYKGQVYAINPKYDSVQGYSCYQSVSEIGPDVDLAVIATPASTIPQILKECGSKGIKSVMILSAGFKEAGQKGVKLYEEIQAICKLNEIRVIGPNCIGIINPWQNLNLGFYSRQALPGNLAFISQSGAISASILDWAVDQSVGFSGFVSIGSMMDVDFSDLIEYFEKDDKTDCILLYIENLDEGKRFLEVASRVSRKKPIIAVKAGRSIQGAKVAESHTGALAANDMVYDAAFEKAGVLRVDTISELFHVAQGFSSQPFPKGPNLAIVTNAGGPAVMATDMLIAKGGSLAQLSDKTFDYLDKKLPAYASKKNPIDVLGDASDKTFSRAVKVCSADENVDGIIAIFTTQGVSDPTEAARTLVKRYIQKDKPIIACWMGEADVKEARDILEEAGIPNYRYPESAVNVFLKMVEYKAIQNEENSAPVNGKGYDREMAKSIIQYAGVQDREQLTEIESKRILNCYNISTPKSYIATSVEEAEYYAVQTGFPVVMKIISPDIGHKIDVGGVILNINDYKEAECAYGDVISRVKDNVPDAQIMGVLVEKMISKKYELLIGGVRDSVFGPAIMFGMGGSLVELWNDAHMALAPMTREDALMLIKRTKAHTLISGFRGMPPIDKEHLVDVIVNFSYLISDLENITEVDINPFAIDEKGGVALDAHMVIS